MFVAQGFLISYSKLGKRKLNYIASYSKTDNVF